MQTVSSGWKCLAMGTKVEKRRWVYLADLRLAGASFFHAVAWVGVSFPFDC